MEPATACEEEDRSREFYCVSYNESMSDISPTTYLTGTRINWEPYITQAVKAVLEKRKIESELEAVINGNDAGSGFKTAGSGCLRSITTLLLREPRSALSSSHRCSQQAISMFSQARTAEPILITRWILSVLPRNMWSARISRRHPSTMCWTT